MEIKIEKDYDGVRVDRLVKKLLSDKPMKMIFKMFKKGDIRVNGKKVKENHRLTLGDTLYVYKLEMNQKEEKYIKLTSEEKELLKNNMVHETEDYFIYNKPSGMVMHKGSGFDYGLVEMFKAFYLNPNIAFVNRLDKSTSGLVIGSKNLETTRKLTEIIRDRNINKHYYALVKGVPKEKEFKVEAEMVNDGKKMKIVKSGGKRSLTHFRLVDTNGEVSLVEAKLETGRKHQIRVHLASLGLPIIGDGKYGVASRKDMCLNSYKVEIEEINLSIEIEPVFEIRDKKK